jgi:16S rRNA (guanine966-N2)-methyltransferase
MRIISGKSKGKKVFEPKDINTRPLKDLTKESIFNIIIHSNKLNLVLENSIILDLFSGVGSFGLECLSRGSKNVTFVENYNNVLPILKKNIVNLGYQDNTIVIERNILNQLNFKNFNSKFDIIFMDPPYKEKGLAKIINDIIDAKIINENGIVIIHRHRKEEDEFPKEFQIIEEKNYGISRVLFGICA